MTTVNTLGSQELSYLSTLSASQGYQVLNKGINQAITNFENTPTAQNDINYFEANIGKVKSVTDFLSNTRLVDFVLSAFGLDQEANYQGLIKQVLTQDPSAQGSLVNQLSDPRFKQMATALDFYDDGLGKLQAAGLSQPKTATSAEGVTLTPPKKNTTTIGLSGPAFTTTTSINTSISPAIGVSVSGSNQYLAVQEAAGTSKTIGVSFSDSEYLAVTESDGSTGYTQSGSFTLNSSGQLALPDGSVLQQSLTFPSDTTKVNIDANGEIYAVESGQTTQTLVGQLQTATFTDPTQLTKDANGYYTATSGSGAATLADSTADAATTYGGIGYTQSGYFTLNSNNQLALPDGSGLIPAFTFPSDTTSIQITSQGVIEANELGQPVPTVLGQLQTSTFADNTSLGTDASGYFTPTTASGTATSAVSSTPVSTYNPISSLVTTVTQNAAPSTSTSAALGVGIGVGGNDYLVLQKSDGTQTYAQSAYFTVNKNNQLQLPDGTTLVPSITVPTGTTALTVSSGGAIYAQEPGQKNPVSIGQLETATFSNPSQLSKNTTTGYYTPTAGSGTASLGYQSGKSYAFTSTMQDLVNSYVQNEFEIAVGDNNTGVREALYFQRTIAPDEATYATYALSVKADVILGDSVLANVAETVLDQPAQIAYQSISTQENIIDKGINIPQLQSPKYVAQLTSRYLTLYDASNSSSVSGANSPALQILSAFNGGSSSSSSSTNSISSSLFSVQA